MTTRLLLYNGALLALNERSLDGATGLTEDRPARRYLDEAWNNGAVDEMLKMGQWTFGTRTVMLTPSTSLEPQFGHPYAFEKPSDHIRTTALCSDEFMNVPLLRYNVENGNWFASITPIFVGYVSNDSAYGGDLSKWPPDFAGYAKLFLAGKILGRLTGNQTKKKDLDGDMAKILLRSKSGDAMERPTVLMPMGSWAAARFGRGRGDRGRTDRLIG